MGRYRKRPIVIDAVPVADLLAAALRDWAELPAWVADAYDHGDILFLPGGINVTTAEGVMVGDRGDWLIRGIKGELYPCKPDIFEATYEAVP